MDALLSPPAAASAARRRQAAARSSRLASRPQAALPQGASPGLGARRHRHATAKAARRRERAARVPPRPPSADVGRPGAAAVAAAPAPPATQHHATLHAAPFPDLSLEETDPEARRWSDARVLRPHAR